MLVVVLMTTTIDLTPFGFTPTESRTYNALLESGPSSGYAVAGVLGIARANAYHALDSLRAKGAVAVVADRPLRLRAVRPDTLANLLSAQQSKRLDELDQQVRRLASSDGIEGTVPFDTERALVDLATRIIVRDGGEIMAVAPASFYLGTAPAWRKRAADGQASKRWGYDASDADQIHQIPQARVLDELGGPAVVLVSPQSALWAALGTHVRGWVAHDATTVGVIRSAIANVTRT